MSLPRQERELESLHLHWSQPSQGPKWADLQRIADGPGARKKPAKASKTARRPLRKAVPGFHFVSIVPENAEAVAFHYDLTVLPQSSERTTIMLEYVRNPTTTPPKGAIAQTRRLGGFENARARLLDLFAPPPDTLGHLTATFTFPKDGWDLSLRLPSTEQLGASGHDPASKVRVTGVQMAFDAAGVKGVVRTSLPPNADEPGSGGEDVGVVVTLLELPVRSGLTNLDSLYEQLHLWVDRCVHKKS